ncbi:hypothetical protein N8311_02695, partial [bacterium]|nr:hypothetical protein [bacterium]
MKKIIYISLFFVFMTLNQVFASQSCKSLNATYHNCIAKKKYPDGSFYSGFWMNGKKEGKGTYDWGNGTNYNGEWKNDKYDGFGVMKYPDGSSHKGFYKNNFRHGKGKWTYPDGTYYEGQYKFDERNGEGVFLFSKTSSTPFAGDKYIGQFLYGKYHGRGVYTYYQDGKFAGHVYEGEFKDGLRDGKGVFKSPKHTYIGEYKRDKKHGYGELKFEKKSRWYEDRYKGYFVNGEYDGEGIYTRRSGKIFEGMWSKGEFKHVIQIVKGFEKIKPSGTNGSVISNNDLKSKFHEQKEQQQVKPKIVVAKKPKSEFPLKPIPINFLSTS